MSFKLQQTFPAAEEEVGLPVSQSLQQPLVRPTTTMGGRKKIVFNKGNDDQQQTVIEEKQDSNDLSEVSGEHSMGYGMATQPNLESIQRPITMHKKIKLKKLTRQNMEETQNQLIPKGHPGAPGQPGIVAMSMKKLPGR